MKKAIEKLAGAQSATMLRPFKGPNIPSITARNPGFSGQCVPSPPPLSPFGKVIGYCIMRYLQANFGQSALFNYRNLYVYLRDSAQILTKNS